MMSIAPWVVGGGLLGSLGLLGLGKRRLAIRGLVAVGSVQAARRAALRRATGSPTGVGRAVDDPRRNEVRVRLVTANLWNGAAGVDGIAAVVRRFQPDVVVLQEVTPRHLRRLDQLGSLASYGTGAVTPDPGHGGIGIWSRVPLSGIEWVVVAGERQLRAWMELKTARVRIIAVHAPAPVPIKIDRWTSWFRAMAHELGREFSTHPHPVIVAGDFNATRDHGSFRHLLRQGLRDATPSRLDARQMTWPAGRRGRLPALVRIDHVLVRANVRVTGVRIYRSRGSDHRPVIVDLSFDANGGAGLTGARTERPRCATSSMAPSAPWLEGEPRSGRRAS